jgi:hypothetical protein
MGPDNQGHVRYSLYNASKNEILKKQRREGKPHGKKIPQSTMHQNMRRNKSNC